jgi:hypothetical protein
MSSSRFYLCAVPQPAWTQADNQYGVDIVRFVDDALGCERRISKEVNLENEFSRYTLTCQRLEQEIARSGRIRQANNTQEFRQVLQAGQFPAQAMYPGYLALLSRTQETPGWERLGTSFYPPDTINQHRHAFKLWAEQQGLGDTPVIRQRLTFLEWVQKNSCGLVELQSGFQPVSAEYQEQLNQYSYVAPDLDDDGFIEVPKFETTGMAVEFFGTKGRKQHLANILRKQIREALQIGEAVTFGNQAPHDVITQVLHEFVFVPPETAVRPISLRVAYTDGSEAPPFPLFCLPQSKSETVSHENLLRVALMSMRHLELDPEIDFCWFRNREVSRTRTLAETDQFCFDLTQEQLKDSMQPGDLAIHLFHTGFEPAVIGFYRGLVTVLLNLKNQPSSRLSVTPFYFRGDDGYQSGSVWG